MVALRDYRGGVLAERLYAIGDENEHVEGAHMRVSKRMALDCLQNLTRELGKNPRKLSSGDHSVQDRFDKRIVDAQIDAESRGPVQELILRKPLRPVVENAGHSRGIRVDAIGDSEPFGDKTHRERMREALGLLFELLRKRRLVAVDGEDLGITVRRKLLWKPGDV